MTFNVAMQVRPSPCLGGGVEQTALVQKFSVCPPKVKGFKVSEDVKSLVQEWADTVADELHKVPGMEKVVVLPYWSMDVPAMQRAYLACGEDKEAVRQLAIIYWSKPKYCKARYRDEDTGVWVDIPPTPGHFASQIQGLLNDVAIAKRRSADDV